MFANCFDNDIISPPMSPEDLLTLLSPETMLQLELPEYINSLQSTPAPYFFDSVIMTPTIPSSPPTAKRSRRSSTASQKPYDSASRRSSIASTRKTGEGLNLRFYLKPYLNPESFQGCQYTVDSFPEAIDALLGVLLDSQPESFYTDGSELNGFRMKKMFTEEALQRAKERMDADSAEILVVDNTSSQATTSSPSASLAKLGGERWRVWMPPAINKKLKACKSLFAPASTTIPMFVELLLEMVGRRGNSTSSTACPLLSAVFTEGLTEVRMTLEEEVTRLLLLNKAQPTPLALLAHYPPSFAVSPTFTVPSSPSFIPTPVTAGTSKDFDFQSFFDTVSPPADATILDLKLHPLFL
ncbi:hypothetical protein HDV05_006169, partial [Chytridiales sp. JEL 0842]